VVATVLMVLGIGTFGLVTSAITTYFVRRSRQANPHIDTVIAELGRWDELSVAERHRLADVLQALAALKERPERPQAASAEPD
jgi:hypothetical protein